MRSVHIILVAMSMLAGAPAGFCAEEAKPAGIAKEAQHELVLLPAYGVFDNLAFHVDGATITLLGQVTTPTLKEDAERAVRGIEGVEQVKNQIEVLPVSLSDDHLRLAAYRAIYGDTALNRYSFRAIPPIHIVVKNGNLTLEGVVGNDADRGVAVARSNSVAGVLSVANHLRIEDTQEKGAYVGKATDGNQ